MEKIALPQKIDFQQKSASNDGTVIVEPLYPGYGNTIGNALRRVLLSSLAGAAVIGVKIKGVKHEFMASAGIKEDVIDIILNLKQLRLKILSDNKETIKLELNVQGKKQVTAKDIKKNPEVEIANPDLVLANITDATGSLNMEIFVSRGAGYSFAEKNKEAGRDIDYIEIDSIFSPILGVNYKVENVRVGKMTNWDKLILDIRTDGTISVEEAFNRSVKILVEQFNSLITLKEEKSAKEVKGEKKEKEDEKKEDKKTKNEEKSAEKKSAEKKSK